MKKKWYYQPKTQPKPIRYRQTNFDSPLHARWAAFFDLLQMQWLYQPDCEDNYIDWQPDFVVELPVIEAKPDEWIVVNCFCYICPDEDLSQLPHDAIEKIMKAHPFNHELEELSKVLPNAPEGFKVTSCPYDRVVILGNSANVRVQENKYFYRSKFKTINDIEIISLDVGGNQDVYLSAIGWFSAAFHSDSRIWMPIDFSYNSQIREHYWINSLELLGNNR